MARYAEPYTLREVELIYRTRLRNSGRAEENAERLSAALGRDVKSIKEAQYSILECRCLWTGSRLETTPECRRSGEHGAIKGLLPFAALIRQRFERDAKARPTPAGSEPPRFGEWLVLPANAEQWVGQRVPDVPAFWEPWNGESVTE
jgi:hypothetical protein